MERLANATIYSLRGPQYTIAHETAVRQEPTMLALAILLGFFVSPGPGLVRSHDRRASHLFAVPGNRGESGGVTKPGFHLGLCRQTSRRIFGD